MEVCPRGHNWVEKVLHLSIITLPMEQLIQSLYDLACANLSSQLDAGDDVLEDHHRCNSFHKPLRCQTTTGEDLKG